MSILHDHSRHIRDVQEGYSQYHALHEPEHNGTGGPSTSREKTTEEDPKPHNSDDDIDSELVTIWTQRLQVLTVVCSFLASMDGQLFSLSALNTQIGLPVSTASREIVYSCLAGALIFHICAALLSYVASFALVRYRIVEAASEEETKRHPRRVIAEPCHPLKLFVIGPQFSTRLRFIPLSRSSSPSSPPPLGLLTRCFYTTLGLTALGFVLALAGILAYVWDGLPAVVGITSSVCLGIGISAAIWAIAL